MTYLVRRLIVISIGILAALFVWPVIEMVLSAKTVFASYFWFTFIFGMLLGSLMGAFFGSAEGILTRSLAKTCWGALSGLVTGAIGAIIGALVAQSFFFAAGDHLTQSGAEQASSGLIIAQAITWSVLGAAIGASEGIRALSIKKIFLGLAGGLIGGLLGGLVFIAASTMFPNFIFGRLLALIILGASIALLYSLLEKRFSLGSFKILNGLQKGKEFLINQRRLSIGLRGSADIALKNYEDVKDFHAQVVCKKGKVSLQARDGIVLVNEIKIDKIDLQIDDVIQIGSVKILYGYFG